MNDKRELRRLIVEDFIDAHYENGCDGARELAWWESHPEAAARLVLLLAVAPNDELDPPPYLPDGTPNPAWPPSYRAIAEKARRAATRAYRRAIDA